MEKLPADPAALASAVRLLPDQHITPAPQAPLGAALGLEPALLEGTADEPIVSARRARRAGFAEEVFRAYAYACAVCGYDDMLGRTPVGLEAAHIRWHNQDGPDALTDALALCALHHTLFDLGVLRLINGLRITVSPLYVARSSAGRTIDALHQQPLTAPRPSQPTPAPAPEYSHWHREQVFKRANSG